MGPIGLVANSQALFLAHTYSKAYIPVVTLNLSSLDMLVLTPSEVESLRRDRSEAIRFGMKSFAERKLKAPSPQLNPRAEIFDKSTA